MIKPHVMASGGAPYGAPSGSWRAPQPLSPPVPAPPAADALDPLIREGALVWGRTPPIRTLNAQTRLFMQGAKADEAFLLLEGQIQLRRDGPLRRLPLEVLSRGDWLGVGEMLHLTPYVATAVTLEPVTVVPVSREVLEALVVQCSSMLLRALTGATRQAMTMIDTYEAQALDQTFLGLCRGLELILAPVGTMAESQLVARLRELFALPASSLLEALRLLDGLSLLKRRQEPGREAMISLHDPAHFPERAKSFGEQWRGRIPSLLGHEAPPEPYRLEELCEMLQVKPAQLQRRMAMADFPVGMMRFDPEAVEAMRKTYGDSFFHKRVSGRELLAAIESVEELLEIDVALLRDILPKMELARLIRLLSGMSAGVRTHLVGALSSRNRKMVEEELKFMGEVGSLELADLEAELLRLCRNG